MELSAPEGEDIFKYCGTYSIHIYRRYSISVKEELANIPFVPELTTISVYYIVAGIRILYVLSLEPDLVPLVVFALNWGYSLRASYYFISSQLTLKSALLITVANVLLLWYSTHNEDMELDDHLTTILMILISGILYPTILRLLNGYSIRIDWKEVGALFGNLRGP